ncbi:DUF6893 family small protein [Actinacidiphila epipremni]|jgi:hypothetical protein
MVKKLLTVGAVAAAMGAALAQVLPDIRRYLRMRAM